MAADGKRPPGGSGVWRMLAEFAVPSEPGNERRVMGEVAAAVAGLGLSPRHLERLKTAVAEATMNAMEHGNKYQADRPVRIRVSVSPDALSVQITDAGSGPAGPGPGPPDLQAKLSRQESPRGWGLFLIKNMVDEMNVTGSSDQYTVELILRLANHPAGGE